MLYYETVIFFERFTVKNLLLTLFNHERYQTISVLLCTVMLVWMSSCSPKCHSLLDPTKEITKTELDGEVSYLQSRIDAEIESLEQQEAIRTLLLSLAQSYVTTGTFSPLSALTGAIALLGTGAVVDNVRKRRDIKKLSTSPPSNS